MKFWPVDQKLVRDRRTATVQLSHRLRLPWDTSVNQGENKKERVADRFGAVLALDTIGHASHPPLKGRSN